MTAIQNLVLHLKLMQITIEETVTSLHRSVASLEGHNLIHTRAHHSIEMLGKVEEK